MLCVTNEMTIDGHVNATIKPYDSSRPLLLPGAALP